jgi:hypothetical protein
MNPQMPAEDHRKFIEGIGSRLLEYFDGYAIVGYHATTGERIIFRSAKSPMQYDGLNMMLVAASQIPALNLDTPEEGKPHE